ncbi:MAG: cadherin-like beta sandwich domain-containing protein [Clostridia bacterium]|nr:cadherin-like beta sandwich domain-containing protein [Clostridia bacterium]
MKKRTKILSCATAAALLCSALPFVVFAQDDNGKVRVVVENNTYKKADGAAWDGTLIDEWVDLKADSTAASIITEVVTSKGYADPIAESQYGAYFDSVDGLASGDGSDLEGSAYPGWMVGYDDWYGNGGISTLNISDGDEIFISYSLNMGVDLGSDFYNTSTKLKSLEADSGTISPEFSADTTEYTLNLSEGADKVKLTPTAENKNYRYRIYKNEYTPEQDNDYKRTRDIPVTDGDVIYIGVGHNAYGAEETVYQLNVSIPNTQQSSQESSKEESSKEESKVNNNDDITVDKIIEDTTAQIKSNENVAVAGNEWEIMTLARFGSLDDETKSAYLNSLKDTLETAEFTNATDYAKLVITLTALGVDATDFEGHDLVAPLADLDFTSKQGINGTVYTLIALDTHNYDIPEAPEGSSQTTREELINTILSAQLEDGGWTFYGDVYDPDMTGMALQALAPYYDTNEKVKAAADKAVELLSKVQGDNGAYSSYGSVNCESTAQVITALSALKINPDTDERFIKNGNSAIDGLKLFYVSDAKGFAHEQGGDYNKYSTDQAYYALCAYSRLINNQTSLYDMSDVSFEADSQESLDESSEDESSEDESSEDESSEDESSEADEETNNNNTGVISDNNSNSDTTTVQTGDNAPTIAIIFVVVISACAVIVLRKSGKTEN